MTTYQPEGDSGQSALKTATFVKTLSDFTGTANLYRLNPPLTLRDRDRDRDGDGPVTAEYVVVSATVVPFGGGPETYIFAADAAGEITSWLEMDGSYRGGLDHEEALRGAGYEVTR